MDTANSGSAGIPCWHCSSTTSVGFVGTCRVARVCATPALLSPHSILFPGQTVCRREGGSIGLRKVRGSAP